jgi:hypothetical protein
MKTKLFIALFLLLSAGVSAQGFSVNGSGASADASAMLDVTSTSKGVLVPRMTTAQRTAIAAPATGLLVFDNSLNQFYYYNGTAWTAIATGNTTNYWTANGTHIYNNNSGNVGIGVTSPSAQLHLSKNLAIDNSSSNNGSLTDGALTFGFGVSGEGIASKRTSGGNQYGLDFYTNSTNRMAITLGGNVGIGTTAPTEKLEVSGKTKTTTFQMTNGATNGYVLRSDASGNASWAAAATGSAVVAAGTGLSYSGTTLNSVWTASGSNIYNNNTANVGIGTSDLSSKLVVADAVTSGGMLKLLNKNTTALDKWWMGFVHDASIGSGDNNDRARVGVEIAASGSGRLFFTTGGLGPQTERLRIDEAGNVGIGTTSPSEKLDISGKTKTTNFQMTNGATNGYLLQSDASGNASWVNATSLTITETDPQVSSSTTNTIPRWNGTALTDGVIQDDATNIGIGTAPVAANKLTVNGKTATTNFQMTNGATNGYVLQSDASGNASWVNSTSLTITESDPQVASATANYIPKWNGTALADGIVYDNGTNIGIGTASLSAKLHVSATGGTTILSEGTSGGAYVEVRSATSNEGATSYKTGSSARWLIGKSNGTESGSDAGSDFFINRYSDAGAYLSQPLTITRSNGQVNVGGTLNVTAGTVINTTSRTTSYALTSTDYVVVFTGNTAAQTLTLPASPATGRVIILINHATVAVNTSGSYTTASGSTITTIAAGSTVQLLYDGSVWRKIN